MGQITEITVSEIGGQTDATLAEIAVQPGERVAAGQKLATLETTKAAIDVLSPAPGTIRQLMAQTGDLLREGAVIVILENDAAMDNAASSREDIHAEVAVLGGGPGGYTAAFRAADLGMQVVLIERDATLGGVCLNAGCIPSKALLHLALVITDADETAAHGVIFAKPRIDIEAIRAWKESVVGRLTGGLDGLARQRKVRVVRGTAEFASPNRLAVQTGEGERIITFEHAIVAAGSSAVRIPGLPYDDPRIMDSSGALALQDVPERMLIIGGGIIGLEMATVYDALGSRVSVVELADRLIPGADRDLVRPLHKRIEKRYEAIYLGTRVAKIESREDGLLVFFEGERAPEPQRYDRVLVAVGRRPNGHSIAAAAAGLTVTPNGFIPVDQQQRTNVPHIYAIGDITGDPMLAHKAVHEGKVAAEVIAGHDAHFAPKTIPSVAYTDPEIAWMGLTETRAGAENIEYEKAVFPWAASGRALSIAREEGLTKVLLDPKTRRILGMGIVGVNAGELIAEGALALQMGATMEDLSHTIHPHPTLSETLYLAAEVAEGTVTDLPVPKNYSGRNNGGNAR